MSRPRKTKPATWDDLTTAPAIPSETAAALRAMTAADLRLDPHRDEPLACILAPVIAGTASPEDKALAGEMFAHVLEAGTTEQAAEFFARVMRLKQAAADLPHRNSFAYQAYGAFIDQAGREPSKHELRRFIEARRDIYRDAPSADDGKGWTRLWVAAGLSTLADG